MESRVRFPHHSIHPVLVVFPLALLSTAVVFDLARLITGVSVFGAIAYWMVAAGLVLGCTAAAYGWLDWAAIPVGSRAKRLGLMHGIVNVIVLVLYAGSFLVRLDDTSQPLIGATVLSTMGAGFALVGGWLGGEITERGDISSQHTARVNDHGPLSIRLH